MGLTTKAVVLDEEMYNSLPKGDRSRLIRDLISNYLAYKDKDIENIDEKILLRKKTSLEHKKIQIDTELESVNNTLNLIKEKRERAEEERLIAEKERIESAKQCLGCKRTLEEEHKKHEFPKGLVCQSCYMNASGEQHKKWN